MPNSTVPVLPFEQTAAGRMTERVPRISLTATLADLQALLWKSVHTYDTVRDVFVLDSKGTLAGTVTSRSVFDYPLSTKLADIMVPFEKVVKVHTTDDQEVAVQTALKHAVESVAVIDSHNKLKGAISIKELMHILQQETQEDLAAEGRYDMSPRLDSILEVPLIESFKSRSPWILVGVGGGMLVAFIITFFEELLAEHILLVGFIPLVVYIVGAMSAQLQMLYVRDSAIYPTLPLTRYALRQGAVVALISLVLGAALYGIGTIQNLGDATMVVALGTGVAVLSALVTGVFIPYGLTYMVKDPVNATAPIATIFSDTITIIIFFGAATLLLV
ncbi:MAG: hypothetical protein RLZZ283_621 [Candidatus Parcubacteria bacterium]